MGNIKNKILAVVFVSILILTTGCTITVTRNHYYTYSDQIIKKSNKNEAQIDYAVDILINYKNEQN